ncbi:MAG: Rrf2 family transcriptional regulator [Oscillospiraceae bacterium]|nr:Rrf2 family transcriptional regulator [Oscillospiraceae bacterium]
MMISTRGRYALRVLVDLAEHQEEGCVTLREIAGRQDISEKYLESIVKELVRGGILTGLRGKGGGYRLGKAPGEIGVLDVLLLTEGTLAPVACLQAGSLPCPRADGCRTLPLWEGLNRVVTSYLSGYTIRDLMKEQA